jgi:hypothetical protein
MNFKAYIISYYYVPYSPITRILYAQYKNGDDTINAGQYFGFVSGGISILAPIGKTKWHFSTIRR